jgi:hypothetical protein
MKFANFFNTNEDKAGKMVSDLLINIFKPVITQLNSEPLKSITFTSVEKSRCRLCLYSMNFGIISYFLVLGLGERGKEMVLALNKFLMEILIKEYPDLINKLENIVLDKELLLNIKNKIYNIDKNVIEHEIYHKTLFGGYMLNRVMAYHNATIDFINQNQVIDPVSILFMNDYFGKNCDPDHDFGRKFSTNISSRACNSICDELKNIFS